MVRNLIVLLIVMLYALPFAHGQANQPEDPGNPQGKTQGEVNPRFGRLTKEVGFLCGQFLPNAIPGITEMMALCGPRAGIRIAPGTFFEGSLLQGGGSGQHYMIGSGSFRGDYQLDDFVASMYIGGDIHYATNPVYTVTPTGSETRIYPGLHIGGALWWEFNDVTSLRFDLKFNFYPGSSLLVGVGLVLRFDPSGDAQQQQGPQ
jgi:hypothetical protein